MLTMFDLVGLTNVLNGREARAEKRAPVTKHYHFSWNC